MRNKLDWTLIGLVVALVFLLGLGAVALVAYFSLNSAANTAPDVTWAEPWDVIDGQRVPPDLGFLPLAGDPVDKVVQRALEAQEFHAAYALIVQSPELSDAQRAGLLLLLGKQQAAAGDKGPASLAFRLAHEVAALSPALPDIARAETTLQTADGWLTLDEPELARASLDMVEVLARDSVYLLDPQRADLFSRLATVYLRLDDPRRARELRDLASNLPPRAQPVQRQPALALDALGASLPIPEVITATMETRRAAFDSVVNGLLAGRFLTDEDVMLLEPTLVAEDQARTTFYQGVLATAPSAAERAAAQLALTNWLTLKLRVARLDLQARLVPDWEAARETIRTELAQANANLYALYRDLASELPNPDNVSRARYEVLRSEILRGRLGLYPDYPLDEGVQRLLEAQDGLAGAERGPVIAWRDINGQHLFTLQPPPAPPGP
mgnify:CR=1 FL=1